MTYAERFKRQPIAAAAAAAAKSLQCPTLCDPTDGSPPGFAVLGIVQARTLKWVAISTKLTNVGVILCCEFQTLEKHIQIPTETWRILLMP